MSEDVYVQIEDAIKNKLHLGTLSPGTGSNGIDGVTWWHPTAIDDEGLVVMVHSDCDRDTRRITVDEWRQRFRLYGLWRRVGMWNFVRAHDPAADDIELCHRHPDVAGRLLHRLRGEEGS